jgi:hypothetical protein
MPIGPRTWINEIGLADFQPLGDRIAGGRKTKMQMFIAKGSKALNRLAVSLGATIRSVALIPEMLVDFIENHALRK